MFNFYNIFKQKYYFLYYNELDYIVKGKYYIHNNIIYTDKRKYIDFNNISNIVGIILN
jgi:hypothetical protein